MTKIKPKARIFIVLEGGLVQSVFCDVPAQVVVADYDTSESDPDELTRVGDDRAHVSAYPSEEWSEIEPATARDISRHSDWWLHT